MIDNDEGNGIKNPEGEIAEAEMDVGEHAGEAQAQAPKVARSPEETTSLER